MLGNILEPEGAQEPVPSGLRWALVGPGKVGTSMAVWMAARGAGLQRVSGRGPGRYPLPDSVPFVDLGSLRTDDLDLLLVAVSDPALDVVANVLAQRPQAPVALHVSGHFDAEILAPMRRQQEPGSGLTAVGSLHPLRAFAEPSQGLAEADGIGFAIDGDPPALELARRLAKSFGGQSFEISSDQRRIYHLAASLAAGGVLTVLAAVEELMGAADLSPTLLPSYLELTRGAIDGIDLERATGASEDGASGDGAPAAVAPAAVAAAITGPAARGDTATLDRQRQALLRLAPDLVGFFDLLCAETSRQRAR